MEDNKDVEQEETKLDIEEINETDLAEIESSLNEDEISKRSEEALTFKNKGNEYFKMQDFHACINSYTSGLNVCPLANKKDRSILYGNRAMAKIKLNSNKNALDDCNKALELDNTYLKIYIRRAKLHEELGNLDESLADFESILKLDPGNHEASNGVRRLSEMITERNEKMKTEAVKHLKTLGNLVLKPFGLSTDNFQMVPNGEGGYSVNLVQNANKNT